MVDAHTARLTRDPLPKNARTIPDSSLTPTQLYQKRLTALRKQNLREGLTELLARKNHEHREMTIRGNTKTAERVRLVAQPPREDERLTSNSIPSSMAPTSIRFPPISPEAHLESSQRFAHHAAKKQAHQHDALHTLYMNARTFITTEEQLEQKIAAEFDNNNFGGVLPGAQSYWETLKMPENIKELVKKSTMGRGIQTNAEKEEAWRRDQERMKRLAEGLSGGKM
jgi:hypothetical protein